MGPSPKAAIDWWSSRAPWHTAQWYGAIRRPEIFAIRKEMGVGVEIDPGCSVGLRVFNLFVDGISIDHDADRTSEMLLAKPCRTAKVYYGRSLTVKGPHAVARLPVTNISDGIPIGPPAPKSVMLHYSSEIGNVVVALHHDAIYPRIVRIGSAIFDIPGFIAELLYPQ